MGGERILYVPNETTAGQQVGPRAVLSDLRATGAIQDLAVLGSDPNAGAEGARQLLEGLTRRARRLQPTIVLWEHPSGLPLPAAGLRRLRSVVPDAVLVYREGDVYGSLRKRLPVGARRLAGVADLVFLPGLGRYERGVRRAGARQVGWAPSVVDASRFGDGRDGPAERTWDVVVIGNRHRARHPLAALPGAGRRVALVEGLARELGPDRFAVFGSGWEGTPGARGALPFDEQGRTSRRAWLTVSWDHFDRTPYFFSNRLPISLLSGVAHLTNRHPGYDELFVDGHELFLADDVDEAVGRVGTLLAGDRSELARVGARGAELARDKLTTERVYRALVASATAWRRHRVPPPSPPDWWRHPPA